MSFVCMCMCLCLFLITFCSRIDIMVVFYNMYYFLYHLFDCLGDFSLCCKRPMNYILCVIGKYIIICSVPTIRSGVGSGSGLFLTKLVRIWSGIQSEVRIFLKIAKLTHEIGFFWHLLNESAAPFERVSQCQFHGESPGESGFFYRVRILDANGLDF